MHAAPYGVELSAGAARSPSGTAAQGVRPSDSNRNIETSEYRNSIALRGESYRCVQGGSETKGWPAAVPPAAARGAMSGVASSGGHGWAHGEDFVLEDIHEEGGEHALCDRPRHERHAEAQREGGRKRLQERHDDCGEERRLGHRLGELDAQHRIDLQILDACMRAAVWTCVRRTAALVHGRTTGWWAARMGLTRCRGGSAVLAMPTSAHAGNPVFRTHLLKMLDPGEDRGGANVGGGL